MAVTLKPIGSLATPEAIAEAITATADDRAATELARDVVLAVPTTTDGIVKGLLEDPESDTATVLTTKIEALGASLIALAKNPDSIIAGAVTGDPVTSAAVVWPGGVPGVMTITSRQILGGQPAGVLAYNITYGDPVEKTFTQPAITRSATGAATNVPQIVVS